MAKKGDVFNFSGSDYLIQNIEEKVVRVTKIVNGKPQKGRPSKMDRELVEGLVGGKLDTTPLPVSPTPTAPLTPVTELTPEQVSKKKKGLKDILSVTSSKTTGDWGAKDGNNGEEEKEEEEEEEELEESNEELSTLFDEN